MKRGVRRRETEGRETLVLGINSIFFIFINRLLLDLMSFFFFKVYSVFVIHIVTVK